MPRPSHLSPVRLLLLASPLISLSACSHLPSRPGPAPQVIKCQPPVVSQELMAPPQVQAINRLLISLGMSPIQLLNAETPSNGSTDSKSNSPRN